MRDYWGVYSTCELAEWTGALSLFAISMKWVVRMTLSALLSRVTSQLWYLCSLPAAGFRVSSALFLNHVFFSCAQYQNLKIISRERNWGSFWAWINPNHSHSPLQCIRHISFAPICSKTANYIATRYLIDRWLSSLCCWNLFPRGTLLSVVCSLTCFALCCL